MNGGGGGRDGRGGGGTERNSESKEKTPQYWILLVLDLFSIFMQQYVTWKVCSEGAREAGRKIRNQ